MKPKHLLIWLGSSLLLALQFPLNQFAARQLPSPVLLLLESVLTLLFCLVGSEVIRKPIRIATRWRIVLAGLFMACGSVAVFAHEGFVIALLCAFMTAGLWLVEGVRSPSGYRRSPFSLLFSTQFLALVPLSAYFAIYGVRLRFVFTLGGLALVLLSSIGMTFLSGLASFGGQQGESGDRNSASPRILENEGIQDVLRKGVILATATSVLVASSVIAGWQGISQYRTRLYFSATPDQDPGTLLLGLLGIVGAVTLAWTVLLQLINSSVFRPMRELTRVLESGEAVAPDPEACEEVASLARELGRYRERIVLDVRREAFLKVAAQVAHDIRSPLAAVHAAEKDLAVLPDETRLLLQGAIHRISDIAHQLLQENRAGKLRTPELVSLLVEGVVSEKRLQYRSHSALTIEFSSDDASRFLWAEIVPGDFGRVISNLISNAVEAMQEKGVVTVKLLRSSQRSLELRVVDTGPGISPEVLGKLGKEGFSHAKPGGSGLGLFHARQTLEAWGGSLTLESELGRGTTVVLALPECSPPEGQVAQLEISPDVQLVALDDDPGMHELWAKRFGKRGIQNLTSEPEFCAWVESAKREDCFFLMDHDLRGSAVSGLDLIEKYQIAPQSVLVTHGYDVPELRERCRELGVRLLPKSLAARVPILERVAAAQWDAVLVDDDPLVRMSWAVAAKRAGKVLKAVSAPEALRQELDSLPLSTPIYVDSSLGAGLRGEDFALELSRRGFTELYLATGYEPSQFITLHWLKGVVGKDAPWV